MAREEEDGESAAVALDAVAVVAGISWVPLSIVVAVTVAVVVVVAGIDDVVG